MMKNCAYCGHKSNDHTGYKKKLPLSCDLPRCNCGKWQEKITKRRKKCQNMK